MNEKRIEALHRIVKITISKSAKIVTFAVAIAGIVSLFPGINLPAGISLIATTIGIEAIGILLDKASNSDISDDELKEDIEKLVQQGKINSLLKKEDLSNAFEQLVYIEKLLGSQNQLILDVINKIQMDIFSLSQRIENYYSIEKNTTLNIPFQAPPLPIYCVSRPEISQEIKTKILHKDSNEQNAFVVSAIHGSGGVGKSTVAAMLAFDNNIQERFPDGVLWITLGQAPDILRFLHGWVQALGDYDYQPVNIEATAAHLRSIIRAKSVLLVIDDAWEPSHVVPFLIGGKNCFTLITTREAVISKVLGIDIFYLGTMTPDQSLELLSKRLKRVLKDKEKSYAMTLSKKVGYLPLALELSAIQIADGTSWQELINALDKEIARFEPLELISSGTTSDQLHNKNLSLKASFFLSLRRLDDQMLEKFTWLGVLPEDVVFGPKMASVLWGTSIDDAKSSLRYLYDKALILLAPAYLGVSKDVAGFRLHDLVHDLAVNLLIAPRIPKKQHELPGLGFSRHKAHIAFVEKYLGSIKNINSEKLETLPNDDYIHNNLAWHLEQSQSYPELFNLLFETNINKKNSWYTIRERMGQTSGYLDDIARAWNLSRQISIEKSKQNKPIESLRLEIQFCLISASLKSLAKNLPPSLVIMLVDEGLWQLDQALTHIKHIEDTKQQIRALTSLSLRLSDNQLRTIVLDSEETHDEAFQSEIFCQIALRLEAAGYTDEAISLINKTIFSIDRADALIKLVHQNPDKFISYVLKENLSLWSTDARLLLLTGILEYLPESQKIDTTNKIREIILKKRSWEFTPERVLLSLTKNLPVNLIDLFISKIRSRHDDKRFAAIFERIAHVIPPSCATVSLELAQTIKDDNDRISALAQLARYLPQKDLLKILDEARLIRHYADRVHALALMINYVPVSLRNVVLDEAIDISKSTYPEYFRMRSLVEIARQLSGQDFLRVWEIIKNLNEENRTLAISELSPYFPLEVLPDVLQAAQMIGDKQYWVMNDLRSIQASDISTGQENVIDLILHDLFHNINIFNPNSEETSEINDRMHIEKRLSEVRKLSDKTYRIQGLTDLIPHLQDKEREEIIQEILEKLQSEEWPERFLEKTLKELSSYFSLPLMETAISLAREIKNIETRFDILDIFSTQPYIATSTKESLIKELLDITGSTQPFFRGKYFKALAKHNSEKFSANLYALVSETLYSFGNHTRQELPMQISEIMPIIFGLGGTQIKNDVQSAIQDVTVWWP
ncbi:MAG: hypothetical protein J0M11_09715 [Anaerolineae bacterium]|nr:hypothetical protein [Anaerolineae bacterium]